MSGFLLGYFGRWAPGVFTALLMAWRVLFTYRRIVIPAHRLWMEAKTGGGQA